MCCDTSKGGIKDTPRIRVTHASKLSIYGLSIYAYLTGEFFKLEACSSVKLVNVQGSLKGY